MTALIRRSIKNSFVARETIKAKFFLFSEEEDNELNTYVHGMPLTVSVDYIIKVWITNIYAKGNDKVQLSVSKVNDSNTTCTKHFKYSKNCTQIEN